ncbi:MAG: hypothetical protein LBS91_08575 [Clostridiales Family XIII bacterium]|jgi:hypothetical protein|nr:hypothetical protein [Clostridiales Family XIII bacterium]
MGTKKFENAKAIVLKKRMAAILLAAALVFSVAIPTVSMADSSNGGGLTLPA